MPEYNSEESCLHLESLRRQIVKMKGGESVEGLSPLAEEKVARKPTMLIKSKELEQ